MTDDPPSAPAAPLDRDVACIHCGYNLRGLSGDPVRCPECFEFTTLPPPSLPAELIEAAFRQMVGDISASFLGIVVGLFGVLAVVVVSLIPLSSDWRFSLRAAICAAPFGFVFVQGVNGIGTFARRARRVRHWRWALLGAHATLALNTGCDVAVAFVLAGSYASCIPTEWSELPGIEQLTTAGLLVFFFAGAVWLHLRMRRVRLRLLRPFLLDAARLRAAEWHARDARNRER